MSVKNFYLTRINNNWLIFLKNKNKNKNRISINFSYCKSSHHWKNTERENYSEPKTVRYDYDISTTTKAQNIQKKVISQISAVVW